MADHSKIDFEHELEESFKRLDDSIKIPEIPDAQSIFERAENEKPKVLPFKKYSRIIAAAAAVVLVCISVPVFADIVSADLAAESEPEAPVLLNDIFDSARSDSKNAEAFLEETELQETPAEEEDIIETEAETNDFAEDFRYMLDDFFLNFTSANGPVDGASGNEVQKEHSSSSSSEEMDSINLIEEKLNKKRSIEITVEEDSVSVVLFDNAAGEEIISAFWVEGIYKDSFLEGETYVISLFKTITEEDFYNGFFLPMAGDAVNGTYTVPEKDIVLPETVTEGVINLTVKVDIGTGEYIIHANLV